MSYDEKLLREFIRSAAGIQTSMLSEEITSTIVGAGMGGQAQPSKKLQSFKDKWGFERVDPKTHPWLNMMGFAAPVGDLWDSFFGDEGWLNLSWWTQSAGPGQPGPVGGGVSGLGDSVISGFTQGLPGHRGGAWQQRTADMFPRSSGILSGPGRSVTSFGAPTGQSIFADPVQTAAAGRAVTSHGVPIREQVEENIDDQSDAQVDERGAQMAFAQFSAAVNQDLHELIRKVQDVKSSPDAIAALEKFNEMFGEIPSTSNLRRDFENATDEDIDKQALLNMFTQNVVPNFIGHLMDVGVQDMVSNLDFTPRQVSELQGLLTQAKMRL